jgi:hypothetical protein
MLLRRKLIVGIAILALAAGVGWYTVSDSVDSAQLTNLDAESFQRLRNEFNQSTGDVRLIVLLSPS